MSKKSNEISYTNWVTIDGSPIKVSDLPPSLQQALGNRVRKEPLVSLGFMLTQKERGTASA